MELKSVTVKLRAVSEDGLKSMASIVVTCTPQEAFTLMSMPCLAGTVISMVPEYGLPSVSEPENKE